MKRFLLALACLSVLAGRPAQAEVKLYAGGETGFETFASDGYATFAAWAGLDAEHVRVALWAPLRLRVHDGGARSAGGAPALRREDWDEWSDRLRVLRNLDVGGAAGALHVGTLTGTTLGHGTIVDRFYNDLDFDTHHTGVQASLDLDRFGAEAMVSDLLDPNLGALRLFTRPWHGQPGRLGSVAFGATAAVDLDTSRDTGPAMAPRDDLLIGLDASIPVWKRKDAAVTAYLDTNARPHTLVDRGQGGGLHLGALWQGPIAKANVQWRGEVNVSQAGYAPMALDTFYAIERHQRLDDPTRTRLDQAFDSGGGLGGLVSVDVTSGPVRAIVQFDWKPGDGAGLSTWLTAQPSEALSLRGFLGVRHVRGFNDVALRDQPIFHASAIFRVEGPWFAALSAGRFWHRREATGSDRYRADLDVVATIGAELGR